MNTRQINTAVLRMLGCTDKHVLSADIELRPKCFPVITLSRLLPELPPLNGELQEQIERFMLVAKDASAGLRTSVIGLTSSHCHSRRATSSTCESSTMSRSTEPREFTLSRASRQSAK